MRSFNPKICAVPLAIVLAVMAVHAQDQAGDPATLAAQPIQSPLAATLYTGTVKEPHVDSEPPVLDSRSLTGVEELSPDISVPTRNYWQPFFNVTSSLDTNPGGVKDA